MTLRYAHPASAHTPSGPAPVTAQAHRHQARGPSDHGMSASTSHPFLVDPGGAVMPPPMGCYTSRSSEVGSRGRAASRSAHRDRSAKYHLSPMRQLEL